MKDAEEKIVITRYPTQKGILVEANINNGEVVLIRVCKTEAEARECHPIKAFGIWVWGPIGCLRIDESVVVTFYAGNMEENK